MRLILPTAAYRLPWAMRRAIPAASPSKAAEAATFKLRLVELGARILETATRIRIVFASACPDRELITALFANRALLTPFASLAGSPQPDPPADAQIAHPFQPQT